MRAVNRRKKFRSPTIMVAWLLSSTRSDFCLRTVHNWLADKLACSLHGPVGPVLVRGPCNDGLFYPPFLFTSLAIQRSACSFGNNKQGYNSTVQHPVSPSGGTPEPFYSQNNVFKKIIKNTAHHGTTIESRKICEIFEFLQSLQQRRYRGCNRERTRRLDGTLPRRMPENKIYDWFKRRREMTRWIWACYRGGANMLICKLIGTKTL